MYTPDRQLIPDNNKEEKETCNCYVCGIEHNVSNSNEVEVSDEEEIESFSYQKFCGSCYNNWRKENDIQYNFKITDKGTVEAPFCNACGLYHFDTGSTALWCEKFIKSKNPLFTKK